jgi:UDP-N-acetylglucosamine--N-acetylmuramyl-(pentapeptide) pyrophosphoryl-undecaprenol N-acetylglucosamine transferase
MVDEHHPAHTAADRERPDAGRRVLFAGGGSAGHVFPGLAVAEVLAAGGWTVTWAGREAGMERALLERRGVPYVALPAAPLVGRGPIAKARALVTLLASALRGRRLVRRLDAAVVVGTGGYVAAPAVLGARLAGRPTLLLEPNARAGVANRFLSRWAALGALAYADTAGDFRCPVEVTGTPVREAFFAVPPRAGSDRPTVLVLGGSQGSREINDAVPEAVAQLAAAGHALRVLHQAGAGNDAAVRAAYAGRLGAVEVEVTAFIDDMPAALADCDLVVSRAGAITLAELCAAGRPALLLPLREAAGHQLDNARRLEVAGAARVVSGAAAAVSVAAALEDLLGDAPRRATMGEAARGLARRDAARRIAGLVERLGAAA